MQNIVVTVLDFLTGKHRTGNKEIGPAVMTGQMPDGTLGLAQLTAAGKQKVEADIVVEDIEIGAVELKNASTDDRATIEDDGTGTGKIGVTIKANVLPLPTNAATSGLQTSGNSKLTDILGAGRCEFMTSAYQTITGLPVIALTTSFVRIGPQSWPSGVKNFVLSNDDTAKTIYFWFGHADYIIDGEVKPGTTSGEVFSLPMNTAKNEIWLKSSSAGAAYRLWIQY